VGLELAAVLSPREDWPFTSAPMFARRHERSAPLYYIEWWVEQGRRRRLLSPQEDLGIGELPFRRGYFAAYYGSADPEHPGGRGAGDGEPAFVQRQTEYCGLLRAAWARLRRATPPEFALVVAEEVAGRRTGERLVGTCRADGFRRPP
jgi:hypothetical protein